MDSLRPDDKVSKQPPAKTWMIDRRPAGTAASRATPAGTAASRAVLARADEEKLRGLCREFEGFFLTELLKQAGVGGAPEGGAVSTVEGRQDAAMAVEAMAGQLARAGGLGLGDILYNFLRTASNGG